MVRVGSCLSSRQGSQFTIFALCERGGGKRKGRGMGLTALEELRGRDAVGALRRKERACDESR